MTDQKTLKKPAENQEKIEAAKTSIRYKEMQIQKLTTEIELAQFKIEKLSRL